MFETFAVMMGITLLVLGYWEYQFRQVKKNTLAHLQKARIMNYHANKGKK